MTAITELGQLAFRDYQTLDVPESGVHNPVKSDIRGLFAAIDTQKQETVANLAALKALTSRPTTVYVVSGKGRGLWYWELGSTTTADDFTVVNPTTGTAGRYKNATAYTPPMTNMFKDDVSGSANMYRFRDRMFVGDAAGYTGNRSGSSSGGYGTSWLTSYGASYFVKNAVFAASNEGGNGGIGILGASRVTGELDMIAASQTLGAPGDLVLSSGGSPYVISTDWARRVYLTSTANYSATAFTVYGTTYGGIVTSETLANGPNNNSVSTVTNFLTVTRISSSTALPTAVKAGLRNALSGGGIFAVMVNEGDTTFGRALYAEAFHSTKTGGASVGIEIATGNYTSQVPTLTGCNPYSMATSYMNGMQIHVEAGGYNPATGQATYTVGDADTPTVLPTQPAGAAFDIAGGSTDMPWQKWTAGIVFRQNSITRVPVTNLAVAISLAKQHMIEWRFGAAIGSIGTQIYSEVTTNGQGNRLVFRNWGVDIRGFTADPVGERAIVSFQEDTGGTVNSLVLRTGRSAIPPAIYAQGEADVSLDLYAQGDGVVRLLNQGGGGENFRALGSVAGQVSNNYLVAMGRLSASAGTDSYVTVSAGGLSNNLDVRILPKGTGLLRYGTRVASGDVAITGYMEIKDDGGTTRRLAIVG